MGRIETGNQFEDFILKNHHEVAVNTAELKKKKLLLSFHPLAWTPVCTKQMQSLDANYDLFLKLNTIPLGISVDSVPCKKAWAESIGTTKLDLLADFWPHGGLAIKLGIFIDQFGFSHRANIILDEQKKVVFVKIYPIKELPDINEIIDFLKRKSQT
jgi:peroxiredoxin